eukprot:776164-Rhodomonas_salina.1
MRHQNVQQVEEQRRARQPVPASQELGKSLGQRLVDLCAHVSIRQEEGCWIPTCVCQGEKVAPVPKSLWGCLKELKIIVGGVERRQLAGSEHERESGSVFAAPERYIRAMSEFGKPDGIHPAEQIKVTPPTPPTQPQPIDFEKLRVEETEGGEERAKEELKEMVRRETPKLKTAMKNYLSARMAETMTQSGGVSAQ